MRFLCDEMLQRLGRWLRAAGYDTLVARDASPDRILLLRAVREGRHLITRDRKLIEHRAAPGTVVLLSGNALETCARELGTRLPIDWLHQPFTRCTVCNTPLTLAPDERRTELPADLHGSEVFACPGCERLYWEGAHVRRMRARLAAWSRQAEESGQSPPGAGRR